MAPITWHNVGDMPTNEHPFAMNLSTLAIGADQPNDW